MAGKSKEADRENKALASLLRGEEVEKRSIVGYTPEAQKNEGGKTRKSELTDIMASVRMPWFCPNCKKVMKQRLDNKFWMKFNHCFDCQIEIENKMRIAGTYDEWEKNKIKENKIAFVKDQIQAIKEWRDTKAPEWLNNVGVNYPELEKEKWNIDMDKFKDDADEALQKYEEVLEQLENEE